MSGLVNHTPIEAMRQDRKRLMVKIDALTAENARLREALEAFLTAYTAYVDSDDLDLDGLADATMLARAALAKGGRS